MVGLVLQDPKVVFLGFEAGLVDEFGRVIGGLAIGIEVVIGVRGKRGIEYLTFLLSVEVKIEFRPNVLLCHLLTIIIWNTNKTAFTSLFSQIFFCH